MGGTFVYSPGVRVVVDTFKEGFIDITDDLTAGSIDRVEDGVSSASLSLANHRRKYDQVFTPNDRISIRLKRINWMPVFTGYLNRVPYFSAYTRTVSLTASCSLKRLQYYLWDPYTTASAELMSVKNADAADGGMKERAITLLEDVVGWSNGPRGSHIHIGGVPTNWLSQISTLYDTLGETLQAHGDLVGAAPSIGQQIGTNVMTGGLGASKEGIPGNFATGKLPYAGGKVTWFGGPNGGAYNKMQISGEDGRNPGVPEDPDGRWFMAMRWPYMESMLSKNNPNRKHPDLTWDQFHEAVQWWRKQRILVINKRTSKAVVLRPADWGPAEWTGNGVDVANYAYQTMDAQHGDEVSVMFAPEGAKLGPYSWRDRIPGIAEVIDTGKGIFDGVADTLNWIRSAAGGGTEGPDLKVQPSGSILYPVPNGITRIGNAEFAWGGHSNGLIPYERMTKFTNSNGADNYNYMHPIAAEAWLRMAAEAQRNGVVLDGGAYRTLARQQAIEGTGNSATATAGTSVHGWGCAIDISGMFHSSLAAKMTEFNSARYRWLRDNASRYGWVNPGWARPPSEGGRGSGRSIEPWHWEFWGIFNYNSGTRDAAVPNSDVGFGSTGAGGGGLGSTPQRPLFNGAAWTNIPQKESAILAGPRTLMNDEPVMNTLRVLMNASGRKFCSAPNGDIIAWFPDYFGSFGTAGKMQVRTIEVEDFTIDWDDQRLKTHMFVTGAVYGPTPGGAPQGSLHAFSRYMTHGIASIEQNDLLRSVINVEPNSFFANGERILRKFGPRVEHQTIPTINDRDIEFWYAVHLFRQNWAEQFSASVPLSFMPELYPGMIMQIEELNFQAYVKGVSHSFNFNEGGGFSTRATLVAPAALRGGAKGGFTELPRAGPVDAGEGDL